MAEETPDDILRALQALDERTRAIQKGIHAIAGSLCALDNRTRAVQNGIYTIVGFLCVITGLLVFALFGPVVLLALVGALALGLILALPAGHSAEKRARAVLEPSREMPSKDE